MIRRIAGILALALVAGCANASHDAVPRWNAFASSQTTPIRHVVIVIQENRSFVNLFRGFPGADAPSFGYDGRHKIPLTPVRLNDPRAIENNYSDAIASWNHGRMDGFGRENLYGANRLLPYSYVRRADIAPYWALARQYVLADRMFPTEFGPSYTAHLDLIAANTNMNSASIAQVDAPNQTPWGCDAPVGTRTFLLNAQRVESFPGPFPCFKQFPTIADTLDAAGVSWRYYAPPLTNTGGQVWSEFESVHSVRYGPDWKNVVTPETRILTDAANGSLAGVSWVVPDWKNSDHTGSGGNGGPSWVASIVNAVGESSQWNSTVVVVLWDDWGSWYDDARPPQLDFRGLGIRVPCIVISPYARIAPGAAAGYVSHTQYEYGSILKLVEQIFNLPAIGPPALGFTDTRAASLIDTLDFTQTPRPFRPIAAPLSAAHFLTEKPSLVPPDDE
ncbi:MAG: hypothetical protein JO029_12755 [Candidatus Eremiobacteraeota bacterium]|nr:hypothetical protein [Candidatus Eremiobacteraeota bacterium]